jgi:Cu(I)/Ag(I) efflux system protein CusF
MKTVIASTFIVLAATLSAPGMAASDHEHNGVMAASTVPQSQMVEGLVKKVDKAAGKVTLAHGPLTNLGMNMPMTMVFRVKDSAWLDRMKEGDKIRFMADNVNGAYTIVHFEPAK